MENNPGIKFLNIHKDIKEHFDFLFKQGFRIAAAVFVDNSTKNWVVTLLNDDWFVKLYCEYGHVDLGLTNLQVVDEAGFLDLSMLLESIEKDGGESYYTDEKYMNEQEQIKSIAQLFRRYFNELITQFDDLNPTVPNQGISYPAYNIYGQLSIGNCP